MTGQRWEIRDGTSGVTLAELHGTHFNKRTAARIAQDIATVTGVSVTQPMLRTGPLRNPTLVHHGRARKADWHIVDAGTGHAALADLYNTPRVATARKIAEAIATYKRGQVVLLDNSVLMPTLITHPGARVSVRQNPKRKGRNNPARSKAARSGRTAKRRAYGSSRARRAADARARAIRAGGSGASELARFGRIYSRRKSNPKWKTGDRFILRIAADLERHKYRKGATGFLTLVVDGERAFAQFDDTPYIHPQAVALSWLSHPSGPQANLRGRTEGPNMPRRARRAVASGRFAKARHHAAASVARGVRRLDLQRRLGFGVGREGVRRNPNVHMTITAHEAKERETYSFKTGGWYRWDPRTGKPVGPFKTMGGPKPNVRGRNRAGQFTAGGGRKRHPKRPVQTAGVRGKAVRGNPRDVVVARARRTFRRLNETEPGNVTRVKKTAGAPGVLVKLGELHSLVYESDKYAGSPDNPSGKPQLYEHTTKRPRPVLATDPGGREVHIVGGRMHPTSDGLVN